MPWLINAAQLDKFRKSQKNVVVFDATWNLPTDNLNAKQAFLTKYIIGARFLDLDMFHDKASILPNMLVRDEKYITEKMSHLGIGNDQKIIFYDQGNLHTSCRALWMFKVFGYNPHQLYILDGGFKAWEVYGGKTESDEPRAATPKSFNLNFEAHFIRTLMQMKSNLHHPTEQVIDMPHAIRFAGGKELRPESRSGHIPHSFSFPYMTMFDADGKFKSLDKIRKQIMGIAVDLSCPIITMCGSAMTASILNFVLDLMNHTQHTLYDGSWAEWGSTHLYEGEISLADRPVIRSVDE